MKKKITQKEVLKANIEYHTKMADSYDGHQPHFKLENIKRVEKTLKKLAKRTNKGSLLDIGCGTGFIVNIAKKYFERVVGIDITPAMLDKVTKSKNVELYLTDLFSASFEKEFDVCTAYSVLHHLLRIKTAFKKIYSLLKKGGYFYADLDPNFYYLQGVKKQKSFLEFPEVICRELDSITEGDAVLESKFNISKKVTQTAEYHKFIKRSFFKEENIINSLKDVGFSEVKFKYQWFLGQGYLKNKFSKKQLADIENYLGTILPLSRNLFKYTSFIAKK